MKISDIKDGFLVVTREGTRAIKMNVNGENILIYPSGDFDWFDEYDESTMECYDEPNLDIVEIYDLPYDGYTDIMKYDNLESRRRLWVRDIEFKKGMVVKSSDYREPLYITEYKDGELIGIDNYFSIIPLSKIKNITKYWMTIEEYNYFIGKKPLPF